MGTTPRDKSCSSCKQFKSKDEYYAHPQTTDGLQSACKQCIRAQADARYAKDPEKVKAQARARYYADVAKSRAYQRARHRSMTKEQRDARNARRRELRAQAKEK